MYVTSSDIQPHNSVLPVAKWLIPDGIHLSFHDVDIRSFCWICIQCIVIVFPVMYCTRSLRRSEIYWYQIPYGHTAFNPQFWWVSKDALRGLTTCSNLVGVVTRCHESRDLTSVGRHDLRINALNIINLSIINEIRQLFRLSLNICILSRSYPSKSHSFISSRFFYYNSEDLFGITREFWRNVSSVPHGQWCYHQLQNLNHTLICYPPLKG